MLKVIETISDGALRLAGAKERWVTTSEGRVHAYELQGRGTGTYLLVHGVGTTATSYLAVALKLRPHAERVFLLNLPGHGKSPVPVGGLRRDGLRAAVREAFDGLLPSPQRAHVLGTSLGGAVALGLALDRPAQVRSLILVSPAGAPMTDDELAGLKRKFDIRSAADARAFFDQLLHRRPWAFRFLEDGLVAELGAPVIQDFLQSLGGQDFFTAEELQAVTCPVELIWGQSDRLLPRSGLAFFQSVLPTVSVHEPLSVGHSPHMEAPGLLLDALLKAERAP